MKNVLDSEEFRKTMRPFLSDKNTVFTQISIEKINGIIYDDFDLSEEFSTFFEDAVRSVNIKPDEYYLIDTENVNAIGKFENHPSVQAVKQNVSVNQDFYFSNIEVSDILKETAALNNKNEWYLW